MDQEIIQQTKQETESKGNNLEVLFATETPAKRWFSFFYDGSPAYEMLGVSEKEMDLEFLRSSKAPLLLSHENNPKEIVGVIEGVSIKGDKAYANIRMGKDSQSQEIKEKINDQLIRNVSVGYTIENVERIDKKDLKIDSSKFKSDNFYRVTEWTPKEISLVGVPLDTNSEIVSSKSEGGYVLGRKSEFSDKALLKMKKLFGTEQRKDNTKMEEVVNMSNVTSSVKTLDKDSSAKIEESKLQEKQEKKDYESALKAERSRGALIFSLSRKFDLDSDFSSELLNSDIDENGIRKLVLEKVSAKEQKKSIPTNFVSPEQINDSMDKKRSILGQYLGSRISSDRRKMTSESLNNLERCETDYVLRWYLGNQNLSKQQLFKRLLTTSNFSDVLADELNKELQMAYAPEQKNWEPLVERRAVSDLKSIKVIEIDSNALPKEVQEGAEYETGSISTEKTTYTMKKYGRTLLLTEETIINDDLSAIGSTARMMGNKVASLENDTFWGIITTGSFFTANNKNIVAATTTLNAAGLDTAFTVIRKQKSLADNQYISITPRYIIVPEALRGTALSLFANITPNVNTNALDIRTNGLRGVISDPRLDDDSTTRWYVSGVASEAPLFQRAHLQGQEMPTVTEDEIKSRDSIGYKVKVRFGFANIDHKAIVKVGTS